MSNCIDGVENSSVERPRFAIQIARMSQRNLVPVRKPGPGPVEPSLSDLIDDPVLHAVMARDGIDCTDLVGVIDVARARLGLGPWGHCCAC